MDKDDQHNNQVGGDFDDLHQDNLPSIWDNISQELHAFEGEDNLVDMEEIEPDAEHLANVADFSVIKEGFELNFGTNQPPKFMWDDIEQELESFTITDDVAAFSAIKSSFETTYKEKAAPNFTWDDLSEEMDNPTPKAKEEDYSFVKSGFEKKYNGVVLPLFDWDDLADRMDSEAILADTPDKYSIIKDSFVQEHKGKTPSTALWASINGQLNLQTTWGRFLHSLKGQTYQYWSKNAMLVGAVAILIGGGKSCLFETPVANNSPIAKNAAYTQPINSGEKTYTSSFSHKNILAATGGELEIPKLLSEYDIATSKKKQANRSKLPTGTNSVLIAANEHQNTVANKEGKNTSNSDKESNRSTVVNEGTEEFIPGNNNTGHKSATSSQEKEGVIAATNNSINNPTVNVSPINANSTTSEGIANTAATNTNSTDADATLNSTNSESKDVVVDHKSNGAVSNKDNFSILNNNKEGLIAESFSTKDDFNSYYPQQGLVEHSFALNNNSESFLQSLSKKILEDPAIEDMEYNSFTIVRQRAKYKKLRFEVGLIGKAGSSLFLGKSILDGLNANSLSTTKMRLTGSIGVMGNCYLSANDAIVVGVYPYSTAQQYFAEFTGDGYYSAQEMKLSYVDLTLGYQRTLVRYNNLRKVPSKLYARLDLGLGYLTKAESIVNNETLIETTDLYNRLNLSLGVSLGNSHEVKQFVFDYGITANVGLTSIMANDPQQGPVEPVHLLNFGGYIGVRYVLFAKMPKKTKQFEWSPPFYIEEPVY